MRVPFLIKIILLAVLVALIATAAQAQQREPIFSLERTYFSGTAPSYAGYPSLREERMAFTETAFSLMLGGPITCPMTCAAAWIMPRATTASLPG